MTNEEFQKIVLEKLGNLEDKVVGIGNKVVGLEDKVVGLEDKVVDLGNKVVNLEKGQEEIKKDVKSIIEQTANLSEFRYEINTKVDKLTEEFNTIEIVTAKNWNDIAKLKAAR